MVFSLPKSNHFQVGVILASVRLVVFALLSCAFMAHGSCATPAWQSLSTADQQFLEDVQARTFNFFWETTNPENGLVVDRWPQARSSSIAGVGFGLSTYCVGVERGFISREQATDRVHTTLSFFSTAPQSDAKDQTTGYQVAPEIAIPALQTMQRRYGEKLFTKYGFLDSFNPSFTFSDVELTHGQVHKDLGWINSFYLAIDQGPIVLMIENFRTEFFWKLMQKNEYLQQGLRRAGFQGGWLPEP